MLLLTNARYLVGLLYGGTTKVAGYEPGPDESQNSSD
jgi:hypothetical protein